MTIRPVPTPAPAAPGFHGPLAVIDIGSNSGRVVVYGREAEGRFRILATSRAALRLVREVEHGHTLSAEAADRTLEALRDFRALAQGAGARRVTAVATSALRDADNAGELLDRVRVELGVEVEVISGEREAWYGFVGALHALPIGDGVLFDMGGGSVQICRFRDRRLLSAISLPLGALRLSDMFLATDPPKGGEVRRLQEHVRRSLETARIAALGSGEELVGTGGSARNLAKIDRRSREYPLTRLHGYRVPRGRVQEIAEMLAGRSLKERRKVPGLNEDRGDSIVGGCLATATLMEVLQARELTVSGQGLREGLAHGPVGEALPPPRTVRQASLHALASRFRVWDAESAARRKAFAEALQKALEPGARAEYQEALSYAAEILDVGTAVDFFDRHEHVADMVLATDMGGFSHRDLALLSAVLRLAGDEDTSSRSYAPLITGDDRQPLERAAVLLALADDLQERCARGTEPVLQCHVARKDAVLTVPALAGWRPRTMAARFERAFGLSLVVTAEPGPHPA
jgi:exopolyphosphatase/guanosine-5'-triphosphate,3'-diphosphate pyrophosphatase